jgi:hypothetical protein
MRRIIPLRDRRRRRERRDKEEEIVSRVAPVF